MAHVCALGAHPCFITRSCSTKTARISPATMSSSISSLNISSLTKPVPFLSCAQEITWHHSSCCAECIIKRKYQSTWSVCHEPMLRSKHWFHRMSESCVSAQHAALIVAYFIFKPQYISQMGDGIYTYSLDGCVYVSGVFSVHLCFTKPAARGSRVCFASIYCKG